jgi:hypothetical protein
VELEALEDKKDERRMVQKTKDAAEKDDNI